MIRDADATHLADDPWEAVYVRNLDWLNDHPRVPCKRRQTDGGVCGNDEEEVCTAPHLDDVVAVERRTVLLAELAELVEDGAVHARFARRRRRDTWTSRVAWLLAAAGWWAALAAEHSDRFALAAAAGSLAAVLVFAVRSGARVTAEREHAVVCPRAVAS